MSYDSHEDRLLVLICTYNEISNLPSLVDAIEAILPQVDVLVIDDQSPDGTGDWLKQRSSCDPHFRFIQRSGKLGLGSAIREGLKYGIEHQYKWLLNLDADWSHDPAAIPDLLEARQSSPRSVDMVVGSRYVSGGGLANCSWKRHVVSRLANWYTRILLGIRVRDCSSAYRCYRLESFNPQDLDLLTCPGYGFLEEILWYLVSRGGEIREVPIRYTERERGDSKISFKEAWGTAVTVLRLASTRILGPRRAFREPKAF